MRAFALSSSPSTRALPALVRQLAGALVVAFVIVWFEKAFVRIVVRHDALSAFHASAIWGVLMLAAFSGFGGALNAWLFPRERADWGLRCAWGWGVAIAAGGVLCAFGIARRTTLFAFVLLGLACFAATLARDYQAWRRIPGRRWLRRVGIDAPFLLGTLAIFAVAAFQYAGVILDKRFNTNDDNVAYFGFAREIIERGTLSQPFSLRRISSYGGKSFLDAIQLAIDVPEDHLHLLDNGMAMLTVMALIAGHAAASRRASRAILLLAMLFVASLPNTRINSATHMTGVVFFLGLYRTLSWAPVRRDRGVSSGVPVALLAAGACTLRQSFLPAVGFMLVFAYGVEIVRALRVRPFVLPRAALADAAVTAGLLVLFLYAWWMLSLRWVGTFVFPVRMGNFNPSYSFFEPLKFFEMLHYIWSNVTFSQPVKAVPIFLAAALALRERDARKPAVALAVAAFLGVAMLIHSYPDSQPTDIGRYHFGFTFAAVLAVALAASSQAALRGGRVLRVRLDRTVPMLVVFALAAQLYEDREATSRLYDGFLTQLEPAWEKPEGWPYSSPDPAYTTVQAAVPEGAAIASMVDNLGHFDHRRNRIASLDMIGSVGPGGGPPVFEGAEALARYLIAQGYRYLIVVDPAVAADLYKRSSWDRNLASGLPVWKRTAPVYFAAFDDMDVLRATRVKLAEAQGMTTLDLATRK